MSKPFTFQAANNRSPARTGEILFTVLALLAFALGSLLLSLVWFGIGITINGKFPGATGEARGFIFLFIWPVTMLVVWICSAVALFLSKHWLLALFSLPAAFAFMVGVWALVTIIMVNISAVIFTAFFILLNIGAILLTIWLLKSTSR